MESFGIGIQASQEPSLKAIEQPSLKAALIRLYLEASTSGKARSFLARIKTGALLEETLAIENQASSARTARDRSQHRHRHRQGFGTEIGIVKRIWHRHRHVSKTDPNRNIS